MSIVVNRPAFAALVKDLGWDDAVNVSEMLDRAKKAGVPASSLYAYLSALKDSPTGMDDQALATAVKPVDAVTATSITQLLVAGKAVVT